METTLFDRLRALELPRGSFAIFGSGPLIVRGIVPFGNDLDVLCRQDAWEYVSEIAELEYLPDYDVTVANLCDGAITFGTTWGIGDFDIDALIATAEIIDGLPFVRLEHVVRYKEIRGNEKDQRHLAALRDSGYRLP